MRDVVSRGQPHGHHPVAIISAYHKTIQPRLRSSSISVPIDTGDDVQVLVLIKGSIETKFVIRY